MLPRNSTQLNFLVKNSETAFIALDPATFWLKSSDMD
jgi:hypothetical protein